MTHDYVVQPGDTLWEIAKVHNGGETDLRKVVYQIQQENHLNEQFLRPGVTLVVPAPSDK